MKRIVMTFAALSVAACAAPLPDPDEPVRYGMPQSEANALVLDIVAAAGCKITFGDFQTVLDEQGFAPGPADPTTEEGRMVLANRFILESTILDMAEDGLLDKSGSTYTSNTGACA